MSAKGGDARGYRLCAAQSILDWALRLVFRYAALLRSRNFRYTGMSNCFGAFFL